MNKRELKLIDYDDDKDFLLAVIDVDAVCITCDILRAGETSTICLSKDSAKKLVEFLNEFIDEV